MTQNLSQEELQELLAKDSPDKKISESVEFLDKQKLDYAKKQAEKDKSVKIYQMDSFEFMMMDLDEVAENIHARPKHNTGKASGVLFGEDIEDNDQELLESTSGVKVDADIIKKALAEGKQLAERERRERFIKGYNAMSLMDIYTSDFMSEDRRKVIRDLLKYQAAEEIVKEIVQLENEEEVVMLKAKSYLEMHGISQ